MRENVSMTFRPTQLWSVGFESFLRHINALPADGLQPGDGWVALNMEETLRAFDAWFTQGYADLPVNPRQADSNAISLCTYEQWFAVEPIESQYTAGCWSEVPEYVARTAGLPAHHVRSMAAFRLGAHHYEVATGRWTGTPRAERLCELCYERVGDEFHVVFECPAQEVPRSLHAALFERFGGWADLTPTSLPADAMRTFMGQNAGMVASFLHACEVRASASPTDDVMFGDPRAEVDTDDQFFDCDEENVLDLVYDGEFEFDWPPHGPP
jgi:hypothetical protein